MNQPWQHQVEAVRFAAPKPAALLHMGMGTGKTRVALDLLREWAARITLVIAPKAVIPAWRRQAELYWPGLRTVLLESGSVTDRTREAKLAILRAQGSTPTLIVANYEAVWREPLGSLLLGTNWDAVIADEIHRAKSPGSRQSKFLGILARRARRRLGLSGTPLAQGPLDAYGEFRFLDPTIFGTSFTRFRARYAVMGGYENRQVVGYINEADFRTRFQSITFHAGREVIELPGEQHIERAIVLPPSVMAKYRSLRDQFVAEVESGIVTAANALPRLLRLQQITSGFLPVEDRIERLHDLKCEELIDVFEDLDPSEPVVVFCRFIEDLAGVHRAAAATGRTSGELSGRRNELAAWQAGETTVLAVQIQSGSEGIDLTRAAYAVFWSLGFSLSQYEQALARTSRPGQKRKCIFIHLIAEGTVDRKVYRTLRARREVIDEILSGRSLEEAA